MEFHDCWAITPYKREEMFFKAEVRKVPKAEIDGTDVVVLSLHLMRRYRDIDALPEKTITLTVTEKELTEIAEAINRYLSTKASVVVK